jgi:hypothetical protein
MDIAALVRRYKSSHPEMGELRFIREVLICSRRQLRRLEKGEAEPSISMLRRWMQGMHERDPKAPWTVMVLGEPVSFRRLNRSRRSPRG